MYDAYHFVLFGSTVPEGWLYACSAEEEGIKVNPIELSQFIDFIKCDKLQTESFIIGPNQCKFLMWLQLPQLLCLISNNCLFNWRIWRGIWFCIPYYIFQGFKVALYGTTESCKVVFQFRSWNFTAGFQYLDNVCCSFTTINEPLMTTENCCRNTKKVAHIMIDVVSVHENCLYMHLRTDLLVYASCFFTAPICILQIPSTMIYALRSNCGKFY